MPADPKASKARRRLRRGLLVGAAAFAVTALLHLAGLFRPLEWRSWDARLKLVSDPTRASRDIVLLAVDQASLDVYEREQGISWPWPRQLYAAVIDFLRAGGARAVFFDLILSETSSYGADDDRLLAEAAERAGNVFLPFFLSREEREPDPEAERRLERLALEGEAARLAAGPEALSVTMPVPALAEAAVRMGNVQFVPDADAVYRRLPLVFRFRGLLLPSLPFALADFVSGVESARVPVDGSGSMILRFHGPSGTYRTMSIGAVINSQAQIEAGARPQLDPSEFGGKIVIVGTTAPGLLDFRPTPFGGVYPGMEILATAVDNLLRGEAVREAPPVVTWLSFLAFALLAGVGTSLVKKVGSMALIGLAVPLAAATGGVLAARADWWVELVAPAFAGLVAFTAASLLSYGVEGRQRRFLKSAFRYYLSPQVIERVLDDPSLLKLGGERRDITAFFSDLAGFTSISESLPPEDLVALLNAYLAEMTDIILDLGGTLDKYEGDAIIAFWNAPLDQPDHALRACRAALRCQARLEERRGDFARRFGRELRMRIGLNSGPAVVGNMGSERRFDYTAMGDTMNLASRLEGASKLYGVSILAGEETERRVRGEILTREVDLIRVVGKAQPVRVFELLGEAGSVPEERLERAARFARALEIYRAGRFAEAAGAFEALSGDPVARLYLERAHRAAASPPPAGWDGVHDLDRK